MVKRLLLFCFLLPLVSCAPAQPRRPLSLLQFTVTSKPSGARVRFSDGEECTTPCTISRRSYQGGLSLSVQREGYRAKSVFVKSTMIEIPAAGRSQAKGIFADWWATAAKPTYEERLSPNPLHVTLEPEWRK